MSEIDERIMKTVAELLPELSEREKERLADYGEGMRAIAEICRMNNEQKQGA